MSLVCAASLLAAGCSRGGSSLDSLAEQYVKLVLAVGVHDADYVDAYYGPAEWREEVVADSLPLSEIMERAVSLVTSLNEAPVGENDDSLEVLRRAYLVRQTQSLAFRVGMLRGNQATFDEEAFALYDAAPPFRSAAQFDTLLNRLGAALPGGRGSVSERLERFRSAFVIPPARLDAVFQRAIAACRARTAGRLALPDGERFTVEYVTDKPWSAYNWYQGNVTSRIEVNTDLPIYIDRAVDLACHEGYPGHHVYNAMLEQALVRGRGWVEYSVYALFSPQSLIAEGTANYGVEMAFPGEERVAFERDSLFGLAGLDRRRAEGYYRVQSLVAALSYAGNEAARAYLNGTMNADEAAGWLERYALMSPDRARQRVRFIDRYRAYVINYNLGRDMVARFVERNGSDAEGRWRAFGALLSSPRLPSGL